jgi:hypothetical protein
MRKTPWSEFIYDELVTNRLPLHKAGFINYYKIFGLYKYNPNISHWKNFCNRLKWPLSHKKLEGVTISCNEKFWLIVTVCLSWAYATKGGPKYLAFWFTIVYICVIPATWLTLMLLLAN